MERRYEEEDVFEVDWREGWWEVVDTAMEERGMKKMERGLDNEI